ncbi:RDD family protein [Hoyosella sp. G463]|uniref:RDD family protein n=1 Tax=Lolliginicoccus lacisalsi TaxID=2742202 RepID=A0A927JD80_9ACTN|nr:RDD family protein [Lolliginicoccus lacisalsi]MBD8507189.1 RDD family protein [Lolliginicoccus lacisalsi]
MSQGKKKPRRDGRQSPAGEGHNPRAFDPHAAYGADASYLPSGHEPADLVPRAIARVIDGLIVGIPAVVVYRVLGEGFGAFGGFLGALIYGVTLIAYSVILESESGQTFGKRIMRLRVYGPTGQFPTRSEAFRRNSFYILQSLVMMPFLAVTFLAALVTLAAVASIALSIARSPRGQGRHDEIADGTQVVRA